MGRLYFIVSIHILLEYANYVVEELSGLEKIGGLREQEDLRGPFIIPADNFLTSFGRDGPLIKGSRDSVTAVYFFTALIFWFVLHQGKMNREVSDGQMT